MESGTTVIQFAMMLVKIYLIDGRSDAYFIERKHLISLKLLRF